MVLLNSGKRIPEDVQVTTHANCGNRMAFPKGADEPGSEPRGRWRSDGSVGPSHALDQPNRRNDVTLVPDPISPRRNNGIEIACEYLSIINNLGGSIDARKRPMRVKLK